MDWQDEKAMEEGYSFNMIILLIVLGFFMILLTTDYYSAYVRKQAVDTELKRVITEITFSEVEDNYLIDRKLNIQNINETKLKIQSEAKKRIKNKYKLNLENIKINVVNSEKILVDMEGKVIVPLITGRSIEMPVKVKGRSKAQRFDIDNE